MGEIRASVALAAYNGENYIREQIDSIIEMMSDNDEIVISYEKSEDNTYEIIREYEKSDSRIRVVVDSGKGVESNFNNAVINCRGKFIFLSDQDDVWINNKIGIMSKYFEENENCVVLICNGYLSNNQLENKGELFEAMKTTPNPIRNFVRGTYLGCQMAFRREILKKVWPVNTNPPLPHDLWLGVRGAKYGKVKLLDEKLILHRIHESNYSNTSKMALKDVVRNRLLFLKELVRR